MKRFFEILPGAIAWLTLILIVVLSWKLPAFVAVFIILFDIYWLIKTVYLSFHLRATYSEMRKVMKENWLHKLEIENLKLEIGSWKDVYHLVIFPMYKEPLALVRESLESLLKANYPKEKFIVVLAIEERVGEEAKQTAEKIREEFGNKFFRFLVTVHPANLAGDIPGKGSNETWAAREAKRLIIDPLVNAQTNAEGTQTNAENEFLYEDLTYRIRGAVFSVKKKLGLGHKEIIYQKALEEEFTRLGLIFEKEKIVEISYEDKKVGIYRPDFIIEDKIILELKSLPFISKLETRQVWQYLKGSNYKLALLANFGGNDIYIKRIVYDTAREIPYKSAVGLRGSALSPRKSAYSLRESAFSQRKSALSYENIMVSVFDIDTQIFPDYFGRLTYVFLNVPNRLRAIYQPIPLFINNVYDSPALARVVSFSSTFWQMMQQSRPERLTSFSSQSLPLRVLADIGFWHTDVVSEDSRIFWQGYLHYHGDFRVEPLFYPLSMDANVAPKFWQTMKNIYKQHRRWGWGAENIPYMMCGKHNANDMKPRTNAAKATRIIRDNNSRDLHYEEGFMYDKKISTGKKWYWSFCTIEGFHSWATNALMIFALGWLPVILGGYAFNYTLLSYSLPRLTTTIMELAMVGVASSAIISVLLLPPKPQWFRKWHYFLYVIQWFLIPVTLIFFGSFPALESQTRLMLGGRFRLGFWVTPKIRRNIEANTRES